LPKPQRRAILMAGSAFESSRMPAARSTSRERRYLRPKPLATFGWAPVALLGAGALLGLVLWTRWGFAIAFDAIRSYCF
jgi:hypothetical protein